MLYRLTVDIYDDVRGDGSELGEFRGTDDAFLVDAASEEAAVEAASDAIVAAHGHAWLVKDVTLVGTAAAEGEDVRFYAGGDRYLTGRLAIRCEVDGDPYLGIVVRGDAGYESWVVPDDGVLAAGQAYRAGTEDSFWTRDGRVFTGTVLEVDSDGVLYVESPSLAKRVWVDPLGLTVTESSVVEWA